MQVKSILFITGAPLCPSCHRALARYLSRFHLAGKLRLRTTGPAAACGCRGQCGCARRTATTQVSGTLVLDQLISNAELEEEGWWERAKDWGRAALVGGAMLLPAQGPLKPIRDAASAYGQAYEQRRKTQQTVDDNSPRSRGPRLQELDELEFELALG